MSRTARSRVVIMPTSLLSSSTGSTSQPRSAISCAAVRTLSSGVTASTSSVITSRTFMDALPYSSSGVYVGVAHGSLPARSFAAVENKKRNSSLVRIGEQFVIKINRCNGRISGTDHQCDSADQAEGSDALELAYDGESARSACEHGATYLAGAWVTAAPPGDLQALERPAFRGEALGCGGGVLEPAAECGGAVR